MHYNVTTLSDNRIQHLFCLAMNLQDLFAGIEPPDPILRSSSKADNVADRVKTIERTMKAARRDATNGVIKLRQVSKTVVGERGRKTTVRQPIDDFKIGFDEYVACSDNSFKIQF